MSTNGTNHCEAPLADFLTRALDGGAPVGLVTGEVSSCGTGVVVRRIDGARSRTLDGLYRAFAAAWDFPEHFGHNKDAFDDSIRDLNPALRTATGGAGRGYLTVVDHAADLLTDATDGDFAWFADSIAFYRDSYRDVGRVFAVVLGCSPDQASGLIERWAAAGVAVARIDDR